MKSQNQKAGNVVYSVIARNRIPVVNPGRKLEIEVFLSGYGVPEKNKLYMQWSSPFVIDAEDPGVATTCILHKKDDVSGELLASITEHKLEPVGIIIPLLPGYFLEMPDRTYPEYGFSDVAGERMLKGEHGLEDKPPVLVELNTSQDARPGDYEVSFTFTYGDEHELLQDYKAVKFHVTGWWEQNRAMFGLVSLGITAAAAIGGSISFLWF